MASSQYPSSSRFKYVSALTTGRRAALAAEREFISCGTELDFAAEEARERRDALADMDEANVGWYQANTGQLPGQAQHRRGPEFDLMPIEVPADAAVLCGEPDLSVFNTLLKGALVDDRAIPLRSAEHFHQCFRGGERVVEQANRAQVGSLAKMEPEKPVVERLSDQVQKLDLIVHPEASTLILDLLHGSDAPLAAGVASPIPRSSLARTLGASRPRQSLAFD